MTDLATAQAELAAAQAAIRAEDSVENGIRLARAIKAESRASKALEAAARGMTPEQYEAYNR